MSVDQFKAQLTTRASYEFHTEELWFSIDLLEQQLVNFFTTVAKWSRGLPVVADWSRYQRIHQERRPGGTSRVQSQEVNGGAKAAEAQWDKAPVKGNQRGFREV
jgi:hypothetical protein